MVICLIAVACVFLVAETSAKAAPVTTSTWRDVEPSRWSAKQSLEWLRSILYSSDSPLDAEHRNVVLEDFEKHEITGSQLMDWLKRGMDSDADVIKLRLKVEDVGTRKHIMQQLRDFVQRFRLSSHNDRRDSEAIHDVEEDIDIKHRHSRDLNDKATDLRSSVFGFLLGVRPIAWLWKSFRWILNPIITLFQSVGLLFVLSSLLSGRNSQNSLLDRSSVLFRQLLNVFYSLFEKRVETDVRGKPVNPPMLMQAMKFLVGGPISIIGGPFAYILCMLRVLSGVFFDNMTAMLPGIVGLTAAYFLLPERLWNPISFVLFSIIGTYGFVRFLVQTYRVVANELISRTSELKRQNQVPIAQQEVLKSSAPISTQTTTERMPVATESTSAGAAPTGYTVASTVTTTYPESSSTVYTTAMPKNIEGRHDIYAPTMATKRQTGAA